MKVSFASAMTGLKDLSGLFDPTSNEKKAALLKVLSTHALPAGKKLIDYHDLLLYICAYPGGKAINELAENELKRISQTMKRLYKYHDRYDDTGLPYAKTVTRYSHDLVRWLRTRPECKVEFDSWGEPSVSMNSILKFTLPAPERERTYMGLSNEDLMDMLKVKKEKRLDFILAELGKCDKQPLLKDHLFDSLNLYVSVKGTDEKLSRTYNRFLSRPVFYHQELLKQFDHTSLIASPLPPPVKLTLIQTEQLAATIKYSLTVTARETDPSTFLDLSSLRLYELDRGISIALYGMTPSRQLPLESYVGFTLFKNGLPASYGGSWIFGRRAMFGINVFEAFRGGESGYVMCQVLRTYRQVFNIGFFEVEPYQFGGGNPDGIRTGAFWFYYRYGFRPVDKTLNKLAASESKKIKADKKYRSSYETLESFTASNMALEIDAPSPPSVTSFSEMITDMMQKRYDGDREKGENDCVVQFTILSGAVRKPSEDEKRVLKEFALMSAAAQITDKEKINLIQEMIKAKPRNLYRFQQLLIRFLDK
jgi:hypothetical protein